MANSINGNLWKTLGIAGMVIGLIGGTIGIVSAAGPGKDVARLERTIDINENRSIVNERAIAIINTKLDTLIADMQIVKAALK